MITSITATTGNDSTDSHEGCIIKILRDIEGLSQEDLTRLKDSDFTLERLQEIENGSKLNAGELFCILHIFEIKSYHFNQLIKPEQAAIHRHLFEVTKAWINKNAGKHILKTNQDEKRIYHYHLIGQIKEHCKNISLNSDINKLLEQNENIRQVKQSFVGRG